MLKHERRILLLKALFEEKKPIAFMDLLRKCKLPRDASPDASYHLTELKDKGIVVQQDTKYFLSSFGEALLEKFFELEDVFSEHTAGIFVRTSRYSMEPFSEEKIAASLMREAKMPTEKAAEIARETRIRLQRAKAQYLTTPLIREYINAILIEKHMEEYRHKLTRLGVPGQDIEDALRSGGVFGLQQLLTSISRETLEQFVLLRILPQELADAVLQRLIGVSRLGLFPLLPEENVFRWADCGEEKPASLQDLLVIILRIISDQLPRFGRLLTIPGVPLPGGTQETNVKRIEDLASTIGHLLKLEDKQVRIIFECETLPEILKNQFQTNSSSNPVEIFCHYGNLSQETLPILRDPTFIGSLENVVPCFESFYCNLLLLLRAGDKASDLTPNLDRLSDLIANILSIKEESVLAYGYPLPENMYNLIRIRPIGLPELVRLHRGFEIDQTEDSEQYARDILLEMQARVSKKLGGKYQIQVGQSWCSPQLLPFTEAVVNELSGVKDILYLGNHTSTCSPGFTRLNEKWSIAKCTAAAMHFLDRIPGEFYLNLREGPALSDVKNEAPIMIEVGKGQTILLTHQNYIKVGSLEVPIYNLF